ncbi:MAG TPA: prepilin-type N-terminal cleavage/methylation domain-containing protein, partial [Thermoanaerobaculia bacterium]|nr:prepilin-type N-terminal cleavage/methylation domain-containing protein [Thermoanaerobaculia bacterium]
MNPRNRFRRRPVPDRSAGFTLIELLVVLGILALVMVLGIPALQNLIIRSRSEGFAREASVLMQRTRLEAIKVNRPAVVHLDTVNRQIRAFVDVDGDFSFNPDPGEPPRTTD